VCNSFCELVTPRLSNGYSNGCSAQVIVSIDAKSSDARSAHGKALVRSAGTGCFETVAIFLR